MIPRLSLVLSGALCFATSVHADLPTLRVTADGRHLETVDGQPFFLLGDTAGELFHRLTFEEAETYLATRAAQGYNTLFAVALAEHHLGIPDAYGNPMLHDNDPARPNEAYFAHVDAVIRKAEELGLYTALLPTWGDKWNQKWGSGPEIFTPENARAFGAWIGQRYKESAILWILGGDRPVENDSHRAILRAMATGIKEGDGGRHLLGFHPSDERNSSDDWPDEAWLDFHMFQSGHGKAKDKATYEMNLRNRALQPVKPTLDGEPRYEDHPVRRIPDEGSVWYDAFDVRQAAWWDLLSGSCGHVYGDHNIWQFYDGKRAPITLARTPWREALKHEGSVQMGHLRRFFEALPWQTLQPDDSVLQGDKGSKGSRILATRSGDGSPLVAYTPHGLPITLDLSKLAQGLSATWFNPRSGENGPATALTTVSARHTFTPPTPDGPARGEDWVLLLRAEAPTE